jgi:hypothetical protein
MKSIEQVKRGAVNYISKEIAPLMGTGKAILLEAMAPTVIEANIKRYAGKEWLAGTGLVDGLNVNVDEIYKLIKNAANGRWPVELFGFRFTESDLDKLINYIREA